jgi:hypothetical protein
MSYPISSFDPAIDPVLPEDNFDKEAEEVKIPKVYTPKYSHIKNFWNKVMMPLTNIKL